MTARRGSRTILAHLPCATLAALIATLGAISSVPGQPQPSSGLINVKDFGARGDGSTDDTKAIQNATNAAAAAGGIVHFPPGTYIVSPQGVGGDSKSYAVQLKSNVTFLGSARASVIKLKNGSTGGSIDPQMFYTYSGFGAVLSNVEFRHLVFDGNGTSNALGPRTPDTRNVAAIYIGTATNGQGVQLNGLRVIGNTFRNFPGANVILVSDRRTTGTFSRDVLIDGNTFSNNRLDDHNRDHSTVNIFADDTRVVMNLFILPETASKLQSQLVTGVELHGSASSFANNVLDGYAGACIFSENLHHDNETQEAIGNTMRNMTYRVFDIQVGGPYKTINRVVIANNNIHFNALAPIASPYGGPYKWALDYHVASPAVVGSVVFSGNSVDGDALHQDPTVLALGIAGLTGTGGYRGVMHLNVTGNIFSRLARGIWQDSLKQTTTVKYTTIVGNAFVDFYDRTANATAVGVHMLSNGGPNGIHSVTASGNTFTNEADHSTYKYGIYLSDAVSQINLGENWFHNIKMSGYAFGRLSSGAVVSRQNISAVSVAAYGPSITIDMGVGNRFDVTATDGRAFQIKNPTVASVSGLTIASTDLYITIRNVSGGALGNVTWDTNYRTSWNNATDKPSSGHSRTVVFHRNPSTGSWVEVFKTQQDVPN